MQCKNFDLSFPCLTALTFHSFFFLHRFVFYFLFYSFGSRCKWCKCIHLSTLNPIGFYHLVIFGRGSVHTLVYPSSSLIGSFLPRLFFSNVEPLFAHVTGSQCVTALQTHVWHSSGSSVHSCWA